MAMQPSILCVLTAILLHAVSGVPGLFATRNNARPQQVSVWISLLASLIGLIGATQGLIAQPTPLLLPFRLPGTGVPSVELDALSAFFLMPLFLIGGLGALYGLRYWAQEEHPDNGRMLRLFWGLCVAGMALLLIARHAILFLIGWEGMALSAFFMVSTEDHLPDVRHSGWVYLVATHTGTLALFAFFALSYRITGTFDLRPIGLHEAGLPALSLLFLMALFGFGLKAGMMPLHFWLPGAHANAPTHVSALMSGVLIKMGIYGLIRFIGFLPSPPVAWGALILVSGCLSGVLGVVLAIGQHDLKRLLAYHSVENIGIILMGFGLALMGRSLDRPLWIALGLGGCLLHVWNHGLFKALLFLSAGGVIHATHTRQIDRLGGVAKIMPWSAALFLIGAVAICGLPPLNGFVSEWLIYLGLLQSMHGGSVTGAATAMAIPVLALIGALALACFVKVYGAVFLGHPRSEAARNAHEAPLSMRVPMLLLALLCALIGLFPALVIPVLDRAIAAWNGASGLPGPGLRAEAPFGIITRTGLTLSLLAAGLAVFLLGVVRRASARTGTASATWGCGYAAPTPRMQYTASSFAQFLLQLVRGLMHPEEHRPDTRPLFPAPASFSTHLDEPVLDRRILPASRKIALWFGKLRPLQRGYTNEYLLYVLLAVVVLMIWTMPVQEWFAQLFTR